MTKMGNKFRLDFHNVIIMVKLRMVTLKMCLLCWCRYFLSRLDQI